jgi:hypothetical protein
VATCNLWLMRLNTPHRLFGAAATLALTPQPFVIGGAGVAANKGIFGISGDGSDGAVIETTRSLSRDMYYTNLTVPGGVVLTTNGYRIFCTGTLTLAGAIRWNGGAGVAGLGNGGGGAGAGITDQYTGGTSGGPGPGGLAGAGSPGTAVSGVVPTNFRPGVGGAGGAGAAGAGGAGGGFSVLAAANGSLNYLIPAVACRVGGLNNVITGGACGGGGGGGGSLNGAGGGGGAGGGYVVVVAGAIVDQGGTIEARGGNGGDGYNAGLATGGGGGGGGGYVVVAIGSGQFPAGISAAGGAGGAAFNGGVAGTAGGAGRTILLYQG